MKIFMLCLGCCLVAMLIGSTTLASRSEVPEATEDGLAAGRTSSLVLHLPDEFGALQRPAVVFKHRLHTDALAERGCTPCHPADGKGELTLTPGSMEEGGDRDDWMNRYHDRCMGCHKERSAAGRRTGPVTCGECHVKRPMPPTARHGLAFDSSLHHRHVLATKKQCERCHHGLDEAQKRLQYEEGCETACSDCHGTKDEGKKLSLRHAFHQSCIRCHLQEGKKGTRTGPTLCTGCHDREASSRIEKLKDIPRLECGQPDRVWIHGPGSRSNLVAFDHQAHEAATPFCTSCHHRGLQACKDCHTLVPGKTGGGVSLKKAYHLASSEHSCVGCHQREASKKDCAGCHHAFGRPPHQRTCKICHNGPLPPEAGGSVPEAFPARVKLAALTAKPDDLPDQIVIDVLQDKYAASHFPHRKIVNRLDSIVRGSSAAIHFHGSVETLCAGCHHHTPVGTRPLPCRACHTKSPHATRDRPGLKSAYHRQCMECHQKMGIKTLGCTSCHAKASKEVQK